MPVAGSRSGRRWGSTLAASLAAAVSTSVLVPSAALAAPRDIDSACPPGDVPRAGFVDTAGTTFEREIDCVVGYGIARGTSSSTFDPRAQVTRGQMASFLANTLVAAGRTRPRDLPDAFGDDDGTTHERNIDWLSAEGIAGGFGDGTYRPGATVTRAQMATFINELVREVTGSRLASATDHFSDDDGNPHERNIDGLAAHGVVTGVADGRYLPHGTVSRQQMAGFLARTVDLLVDGGHLDVPFGPDALAVEPTSAARFDTSDNAGSSTADRGARTYTVAVPIGIDRVDVALFPADHVTVSSAGPRFTSNATIAANAGTSIETINGATLDPAGGSTDVVSVANVAVRDHQVTFRVDSTVVHAVVPVVWTDTIEPSQDRLDLEAGATSTSPKPAREVVAVGGALSWGPVEPSTGTNLAAGTVRQVNPAAGWYTLDTSGNSAADHLLRFHGNDAFSYTASNEPKTGSPGPITHAQFQSWLSVGDRVDPGAYQPGKGSHVIVGDVPGAPTNVAAVVQQDGRVKVSWTKPTNPVADDAAASFRLERAPVSAGTVGTFVEVRSQAGNLAAELVDTPTAGSYAYRVLSRSVTGTSPASAATPVTVTTPAPATTGSRVKTDNGANNSGNANGLLDHGDELEFTFDRAVTVAGNWQLLLVDADGTQARLDNTASSLAVSGTGGNIVTITVATNGPLTAGLPVGSTGGLAVGSGGGNFLQVVSASGFSNVSGTWNLPKSGIDDATWNASRFVVGKASSPPAPQLASATAATRLIEAGRNEVQVVSASSDATGGTWALALGTGGSAPKTSALAWDISADDLRSALEAVAGIGAGNVAVSGSLATGFTVTFQAGLSATDVPQLTVVDNALTKSDGTPTAPVGSTQTAGVSVNGTIVAGDTLAVYTVLGQLAGSATAGPNGRTTVTVGAASVGQPFHVVVERANGHRSRTATITAT